MKETLFIIPQSWFSTWIIAAWVLIGTVLAILNWRGPRKSQFLKDFLPVFLIGGAIIYWVLPKLSISVVNPENPLGPLIPGGLAIRGYGLFLMLSILSGIGLVILRCRQIQIDAEPIITLCFVMVVCGLIGARVFFVIQKWEDFQSDKLGSLVVKIVDMTRGGLVVYGSLIGGLLGAVVYLYRKRLPIRNTLDVLAPAMILGLAIGRIGCLMNGCCYGGVCSDGFPLGMTFPAGSPPYEEQLGNGMLLGLKTTSSNDSQYPLHVESVTPDSLGAQMGIQLNEDIAIVTSVEPIRLQFLKRQRIESDQPITVYSKNFLDHRASVNDLPARSLRIHPTQLYASINAFLLCGLLWFWYPRRQFVGQDFALLMILYPISRFVEEAIRIDERGVWGTSLSISQVISLFVVVAGFVAYYGFSVQARSEQATVNS